MRRCGCGCPFFGGGLGLSLVISVGDVLVNLLGDALGVTARLTAVQPLDAVGAHIEEKLPALLLPCLHSCCHLRLELTNRIQEDGNAVIRVHNVASEETPLFVRPLAQSVAFRHEADPPFPGYALRHVLHAHEKRC